MFWRIKNNVRKQEIIGFLKPALKIFRVGYVYTG